MKIKASHNERYSEKSGIDSYIDWRYFIKYRCFYTNPD